MSDTHEFRILRENVTRSEANRGALFADIGGACDFLGDCDVVVLVVPKGKGKVAFHRAPGIMGGADDQGSTDG